MNWYIGQKVVCVEGGKSNDGNIIKEGFTYTVFESGYYPESSYAHPFNYLKVAEDPSTYWSDDRFRPLEENFAERTLNKAIEQAEEILEIIETVQPVDNSK